ncbi:MAG TPA: protein translocase subunit SecD [Intrasporangiaceae bacterium]|nr:protein translocase subunit SecD [Intrasporangiaceae bacterium]
MSTQTPHARPGRVLAGLATFFVVLLVVLLAGSHWGDARLTPRLGLDLEGGTQMVLTPVLTGQQQDINQDQLDQARDIINQRADAGGIAGAEVTTQGGRNIVVSMPGVPSQEVEDAIRRSSQLQFRPVLVVMPTGGLAPLPTPTDDVTDEPTGEPTDDATESVEPTTPATPEASPTTNSGLIPQGFAADATPTEAPTDASTDEATESPAGEESADPGVTPTDPTDPAWVTDALYAEFEALDCTTDDEATAEQDPAAAVVACRAGGGEKYILGPVVVDGSGIADASAGYQAGPQGQPSSTVEIALELTGDAREAYGQISSQMVQLPTPRNQLAAVLDRQVIVAPYFQSAILDGRASITGGFTIEEARALAQQLKFGALPMSFALETRDQVSPLLGGEQLRMGLLAGLIGMILVFGYSLFQYRLLGFVTIGSLVLAGALTYLVVTLLGWRYNYRLDMAGVTGLIVAVGITADSFIVFFERVRDEVRDGRTIRSAVDAGWERASRTILAGDAVTLLAAGVLWTLASSNVRGFAFTLGLTTIIDLIIVFFFTKPMMQWLTRREFFGQGHKLSGLNPELLGARNPIYAGRGRVRGPITEGAQA